VGVWVKKDSSARALGCADGWTSFTREAVRPRKTLQYLQTVLFCSQRFPTLLLCAMPGEAIYIRRVQELATQEQWQWGEMMKVAVETRQRGIFERIPGSNHWWIRYADATGRVRYEKAGHKSAAIDLYRKRKTEVLQRKKLPEKFRERAVTFDELAEDTLAYSRRHHGPKTQKVLAWMIATLRERFGPRPAATITVGEIEEFVNGRGKTKATANRWRSLFSLIYHRGVDRNRIQENPVRKVPRHREHMGRTRFLSPDEEKSLRAVIKADYPDELVAFDLALHTGMRRSEQYGLTWDCVDLERRQITIPRSKHGGVRYIPLNSAAEQALLTLRTRSNGSRAVMVTAESGHGYHAGHPLKTPREWFDASCRKAGVLDFTWHCLRHTFASRLVMAGVPLRTVQELMGHKTIQMTIRYSHLAPGHMQEAVDKLVQAENATEAKTETDRKQEAAKEAAYVN
jgi:integrase